MRLCHRPARPGLTMAMRLAALPVVGLALSAHAEPVKRATVEAALPAFEALVQQAIDRGEAPGIAIAIVVEDQVVYLKGFGVREAGKPETVDADTVFQIASLSKPLSATVVAAVVGDGRIGWDARISDLDPGFRLAEAWPSAELTVTDLFNHRSGLPGGAGNELEELGFDRATILERLRQVPLDGFRSTYSYSNFGLTEGGVAVARAEGVDWADLAETRLFRPLGMTSTSARYADFLKHPDRAVLHVGTVGAWEPGPIRMPDAQAPAGGVSSTARDLAEWLRLELAGGSFNGKPLIDPAALAATHEPLMPRGQNPVTGAASFYGRGWNVEYGRYGLMWGHAGAFSTGSRTLANILPEQGIGFVAISNAFPSGLPEGLSDSFFDLVFKGKVEKDWIGLWDAGYGSLFGPAIAAAKARYATPTAPTPASPDAAYLGGYANNYLGKATIVAEKGGLVLALGPDGDRRFPLTHFDRDLFLMYGSPEMPELPSAVTFTIGPDGRATGVTLEAYDDLGLGTMKRAD